jgi:ectoine hydroxylase-related dioxygenase (phytanoyl-CoA dioxygenase family)
MESTPFQRGDCLLVDSRTIHAGMANASTMVRPILYMMYCREWFYDDCNHRQRLPLDITLEEIQALPKNVQSLMLRAHQQAIRTKSALRQ